MVLQFLKQNLESKIELDFKSCPDLVLPFAVACLCKGVEFKFSGVKNLRLKESDRIASLQSEALKIGFVVEVNDSNGEETLEWHGKRVELNDKEDGSPLIDPHGDHRVAMAFAMTAFTNGEVRIQHPEVVEKSFIDFWNQLGAAGLQCHEDNDIMTVKK